MPYADVNGIKLYYEIHGSGRPVVLLQMAGEYADRLVLVQKFREQQVVVDVDNALSAIERAKERVAAATESLRMAKTLEEGERFRFSLGATSVLFVNLRERNSVDSEMQLVRAKADYQKALALYQWATGTWAKSQPSAVPVNYRIGSSLSK